MHRYLTVKGLSEITGLTQASIRNKVTRRELPYRRLGKRRILFIEDEIEKFIEDLPGLRPGEVERAKM